MNNIYEALNLLFQKHRIVFWYDQGEEMRAEYEALNLPEVEKLVLDNNEFGLKYHILRQAPKTKFLLYSPNPQPVNLDNWLLDLQLANVVFSADKFHLWLAELELGPEYLEFVKAHEGFFNAESRRSALKDRGIKGTAPHQLSLLMLAVTLGSGVEANLESILFALFEDLAQGETDAYNRLEEYNLLNALWLDLKKDYGYTASNPHIKDFAISLFESAFNTALGKPGNLSKAAGMLLSRWKDSHAYSPSFEQLSNQFALDLNITKLLQNLNLPDLLGLDLFKEIDERILEILMHALQNRTISEDDISEIVRRRQAAHWFSPHFENTYLAILSAAALLSRIQNLVFYFESLSDGLNKYRSSFYQIDQYYRKFIYYMRCSGTSAFFNTLNNMVEKYYTNNFLRPLNDNWQAVVDAVSDWHTDSICMQREFFNQFIDPILSSNAKVAIIISDGLRYEVGLELADRIEREGRFSAELDAMLGVLPSYTQLGMAALLPNSTLEIQANGSVLADGISTLGSVNRAKVLTRVVDGSSQVQSHAEIVAMSNEQRRALFRENKVVFVYHNQIDAAGDTANEDSLFDSVETALVELISLVKILRNANFTSIMVTSDHGFLYQYQPLGESDFVDAEVESEAAYAKNRRFIVGLDLKETMGLHHYQAAQLGLIGQYEIMIAKGINRLRVKGAASRYVHGGASLQEVVIPVVLISKERGEESEIRKVGVDKINTPSNKITTGQVSVAFYQVEPVSAKVQGVQLRAGIYAVDGKLISNLHVLQFSFDSENPRDRQIMITFMLSDEANKYNRQPVSVRLEEKIPDTEKYRQYAQWEFQLDKTRFAGSF